MDYVSSLSEEEKDWLNDFYEEYYGANLDFKNLKNNRFHRTKKDKKACTDRNNARNRCMYGIARASNKINNSETIDDGVADSSEDSMIALIDSKK